MCPQHLKRVESTFAFLTRVAPLPSPLDQCPGRDVSLSGMRAALAAYADSIAEETDIVEQQPPTDHDVLFLPQHVYRTGVISRESELSGYAAIIRMLVDLGYTVHWKDHPRIQEDDFSLVSCGFSATVLKKVNYPRVHPVEVHFFRRPYRICVGSYSSSLFYLREIYGVHVYSFARLMAENDEKYARHDAILKSFAIHHLPDISQLPPYK